MKNSFKYNGISFNTAWASKLSEADFVKEFTKGRPAEKLDDKQAANFAKFQAPYDLDEVQLKEAYKLIKEHVNNQKPNTQSGEVSGTAVGKSGNIGNKGTDPKL
jgi:hypothetical protein